MKNLLHIFLAISFFILTANRTYSTNSNTLNIICSDLVSDGIGSAYKQYTFSLDYGTAQVSDYKWTFKLKKTSGEYAVVSVGNSSDFTTDAIADYNGYYVNTDGALSGLVECSCSVDGNDKTANIFAVSLELKPVIFSIDKQIIENKEDYSFYVLMDIKYAGADYVQVEIEEDYDPSVRSYMIYEPFLAHAKTGNITSLYDSWVTIKVRNQYGEVSETFHFEPIYDAGISDALQPEYVRIEIYSVDGLLIYSGAKENFNPNDISSGLYIKKIYDESSRHVKTSKFHVK